jgi:hypothetical protein
MVTITGNTYPVKEQLKSLGAKWDSNQKAWLVPDAKAEQARQIVASGAANATTQRAAYRPRKCSVCGHEAATDNRGYPIGDRILRSGECQSCYEERKMGY